MFYGNTNVNPETQIRYGVLSAHRLHADVFDSLRFGGTDHTYNDAVAQLRKEVNQDADTIEEECTIGCVERGLTPGTPDFDSILERDIEAAYERLGYSCREDYVESRVERESEWIEIDEPFITGTHDGVNYQITWLGGAPLVWSLDGPVGYALQLCSPCVPNAADLDAGLAEDPDEGYICHTIPANWFDDEEE